MGRTDHTTTDRHDTKPAVNFPPVATVLDTASIDEPTSQAGQSERTKNEKPKHDWIDRINSLSTVAMAAFTILIFVIMRRQLRATQIVERAWIVPDIGDPEPTQSKDTVQVICKIWNKGHTPAWITAMGACGQLVKSDKDLPEEPPYTQAGPFSKKGSALSPNAHTETGIPITIEQLKKAREREITLYFLGYIEYRDAFGEMHTTRYCFQMKPSQDLTKQIPLEFYVGGPHRFNTVD